MKNWYYVTPNGEQKAASEEDIKNLIKQGFLTGNSLVWEEGTPNWVPVSSTGLWNGPPPMPAPAPPIASPFHSQPASQIAKPLGGLGSFMIMVGVLFLTGFIDIGMDAEGNTVRFLVLISAVGIAIDAAVIKASSYEKGYMWGTKFFTHHPFGLFVATMLIWLIAFPYYLCLRSRIKLGLIPKKATT